VSGFGRMAYGRHVVSGFSRTAYAARGVGLKPDTGLDGPTEAGHGSEGPAEAGHYQTGATKRLAQSDITICG
jgi:hypothetical protein